MLFPGSSLGPRRDPRQGGVLAILPEYGGLLLVLLQHRGWGLQAVPHLPGDGAQQELHHWGEGLLV